MAPPSREGLGLAVKREAEEGSEDHVQVTLFQTLLQTTLSPRNMKLDAKKDFEVSQSELLDRCARS